MRVGFSCQPNQPHQIINTRNAVAPSHGMLRPREMSSAPLTVYASTTLLHRHRQLLHTPMHPWECAAVSSNAPEAVHKPHCILAHVPLVSTAHGTTEMLHDLAEQMICSCVHQYGTGSPCKESE